MHGPNLWPMVDINCPPSSNTGGSKKESTSTFSSTSSNKNEEEFCQSFRHDMANYFDDMLQLSRHVARALALSLNLQGDFFTNCMTDPVAQPQLVTFKYPPEEEEDDEGSSKGSKQISCREHADCGTMRVDSNINCEASSGGEQKQQNDDDNDDDDGAVVTAGEYILEKLGLMWLMNEDK
eukprot:scaffold42966_cov56-Attheya_sp.AAC.4